MPNSYQEYTIIEKRVAGIFTDAGWTVRQRYFGKNKRYEVDLALFDEDKWVGAVEVKAHAYSNRMGMDHLQDAAKSLIYANDLCFVMLFIGEDAYLYTHQGFVPLNEVPTPKNYAEISVRKPVSRQEMLTRPAGRAAATSPEMQALLDMVKQLSAELAQVRAGQESLQFNQEKVLAGQETLRSGQEKVLAEQESLRSGQEKVLAGQQVINEKLDAISEKLAELAGQITAYQSLVSRQLERAGSEDEKEIILSSFSDELIERIRETMTNEYDLREHDAETERLKLTFGDTWARLQPDTQRFLVSAKILFKKQIGLGDLLDYSSVCVLLTKALEVECSLRFYQMFMDYVKAHYPGRQNYPQYPSSLLNQYGKPKRAKDYTLGTVAFTLCLKYPKDHSETQKQNDREKLLEFCKAELIQGMDDDDILDLLASFAEEIEEAKDNYRNPSAHTNSLDRVSAKECMDMIVDVEKLLKRLLDALLR